MVYATTGGDDKPTANRKAGMIAVDRQDRQPAVRVTTR